MFTKVYDTRFWDYNRDVRQEVCTYRDVCKNLVDATISRPWYRSRALGELTQTRRAAPVSCIELDAAHEIVHSRSLARARFLARGWVSRRKFSSR